MRAMRRARNVRPPPGAVNSGAEAWTMMKPEMTKNTSTPASQGKAAIGANAPPARSASVAASCCACSIATDSAAIRPTRHFHRLRKIDRHDERSRALECVHRAERLRRADDRQLEIELLRDVDRTPNLVFVARREERGERSADDRHECIEIRIIRRARNAALT